MVKVFPGFITPIALFSVFKMYFKKYEIKIKSYWHSEVHWEQYGII